MKKSKGFTLIELVMVLVLIGILAAVAIPRFHDMQQKAQEASVQGALGNVRSAISIWRANDLAEGISSANAYPTLAEMQNNSILDSDMPENPFADANPADVEAHATKGQTDGDPGWRYNASAGEFWANSNEVGEAE